MSGLSTRRRTSRIAAVLAAALLMTFLSACFARAAAVETALTVVSRDEVISCGMTRAQVERQLGKPEKENQMPPAGELEDGRYTGEGGTVNIVYRKDRVVLVMVKHPGWTTPEGVGVGSTLEEVLRSAGLESLTPVHGQEGYAYLACYRRRDGVLQACTPEDYLTATRENAEEFCTAILGFDEDGTVREISMGDKLCLQYFA